MKFDKPQNLASLAQLTGSEVIGDAHYEATGLNEIHMVEPGDITFVNVEKYFKKALESAATVVIINQKIEAPQGKHLLYNTDPFMAWNTIGKHFRPVPKPARADAYIKGEDVTIGEGTVIHPNVVIGNHVHIGKNCIIYPNVTLYDHTIIGDNVIINANSTVGGDAFYFSNFQKMHTCGRVVLHDWVEIGAGCTVDRGVSGDTILGAHTKLDSQVHIGHDVHIGEYCLLAAQVGVGGCTTIENRVIVWGRAVITKDVVIGEGAVILGGSGVSKSLEGGKTYFGSPAQDSRIAWRELATLAKMPDLLRKLEKLNLDGK